MENMQWKNSSLKYGKISVIFHWVSAMSIIGLFIMGLWMVELDYYHAFYTLAPWIHQGLGILLFVFMFSRLVWRIINPAPSPMPAHNRWEVSLSKVIHLLIYLLIFMILMSGYLITTADGRSIEVFGWFDVPAIISYESQEDIAGWIHWFLSYGLMGLVVLHILGALKHQFIDKDKSINRML